MIAICAKYKYFLSSELVFSEAQIRDQLLDVVQFQKNWNFDLAFLKKCFVFSNLKIPRENCSEKPFLSQDTMTTFSSAEINGKQNCLFLIIAARDLIQFSMQHILNKHVRGHSEKHQELLGESKLELEDTHPFMINISASYAVL